MQRSTDRILTTHTGSLPRPVDLLETMRDRERGASINTTDFNARVQSAVAENVHNQHAAGIDVVNDGEVGKPSFNAYILERLSGFETRPAPAGTPAVAGPIDPSGRDAQLFPDYYAYVLSHSPFEATIRMAPRVCVAPLQYVGQDLVGRDIANLKKAMAEHNVAEGFLPSASPLPTIRANEYYRTEEEYVVAYADAMREEYTAILDAGLLLQIDDPRMVSTWDSRNELTLEEYRRDARRRVAVLNYALRDLPQDRIRYHTCYGVNFGPRVSDLQLEDVIDILFEINVGAYSFEAANPRHEHEWRLFERVRLPHGKVLIPGMVTHSNVMIEHPMAVADRIERWARTVGKENLLIGNDCGFASTAGNAEIPPTVAWAKLEALGAGARLASERLY
ncbi:MAG: cobalamin-independent methionine synthase II family protein [Chloroflexota bacterium]